jgi:hypothetical protein
MKRSRSRWTSGSAFSVISSEALVWWMNRWHSPVFTPLRPTTHLDLRGDVDDAAAAGGDLELRVTHLWCLAFHSLYGMP